MEISIIQGYGKYHFGVKLQSRELNPVLKQNWETGTTYKMVVFVKVLSGFRSISGKS